MPPKTRSSTSQVQKPSSKGKEKETETSKRAGKRPQTQPQRAGQRRDENQTEDIPIPDPRLAPFTEQEREDYERLKKMRIDPTKYISNECIEFLEIKEDVNLMLDNMGLAKFRTFKKYTVPILVREFFATVELVYAKPRTPSPDEGVLKFKIRERAYQVTIKELCEIYGFRYGSETKFRTFHNIDQFWNLIANGTVEKSPKIAMIRNPAIRIVAKYLASTLFGRPESGTIKIGELCMLFKGLYPLMESDEGPLFEDHLGDEWNLGCIFAKELVRTRSWSRYTTEPIIVTGGIIMPLFNYLNIQFASHRVDQRAFFIDGLYLKQCKIIEDHNTYRYFIYLNRNKEKKIVYAPCPDKTSIATISGIAFEFDEEAASVNEPPPRPSHPLPSRLPKPTLDMDTWTLPKYDFKPVSKQEKALHTILKFHRRVTKMAKRKFDWLERKIRQIPGYVSDEEPETNVPNASSDDDDGGENQDDGFYRHSDVNPHDYQRYDAADFPGPSTS